MNFIDRAVPPAAPTPVETARAFFRISRGYWQGRTRIQAMTLTGVLAAIILVNIGIALLFNAWNRFFFDALERRDVPAVMTGVGIVLLLAALSTGVAVMAVHARMGLQLRWRAWLTHSLIERWLSDRRFYQLTIVSGGGAHPEFRIADDVRLSVEPLVDFAIGLFNSVLSAAAFFGVLWVVAGSLAIGPVVVPGYMVFAALAYAALTSGLMLRIGRPLIGAVEQKNAAEARLRYELTRVRESAENIALIGGDDDERERLDATFADLAKRWLRVIAKQAHMTWVSNGNGALMPVVPLLLGAPKYLSGQLTLGELMQVAAAFAAVQAALNWLVDNAIRVAETVASCQRVTELTDALDDLDETIGRHGAHDTVVLGFSQDDAIHIEGLSLTQQDGTVMIEGASTTIGKGEKVLVKGESGTGKSTLIRAMAGLWPWGSGRILRPRRATVAFMPQRPYLPLGTLRRVLLYPSADDGRVSDDKIRAALRECGLAQLAARLEDEDQWDQVLSGGERQRIAFARLLIHPPDIVIMDEATSALDDASQARMMGFFRDELADATLLSVGHRPGLEVHHDREIYLVREDADHGAHARHRRYPRFRQFWSRLRRE